MCSLPNDPVLARRVVAGIIFLARGSLARLLKPRHSHLLIGVLAGCAKFTWRSRWAGRVLRLCARNQWAQVRCIPFYLCLYFALFIISHKTSLLTIPVHRGGVGGSYRVDQNSDVLRTECQNNVDRVVKLMVYSSKEMNIRAVDMTPVCYCPQPPFTL